MSAAELRSVLVVGTGLIGASVGLALRARGVEVYLRDTDPEAVAFAIERGAGLPDGDRGDVDLAVVAVPPHLAPRVVQDLLDEPGIGAVTDVTSVKAPLAGAVSAHVGARRYVGGHPMAGREVSGPGGAHHELFRGRPWVICPPDEAAAGPGVELVTQLALLAGATPVRMSPAEHDAAVAVVSHAPHLVAALVAGRLRDAEGHEVRLAGGGVRDITRVAASDPAMWREILAANAVAVREVLRALRDDLDTAITALETDRPDLDGVEKLLHAGVAGRGRLPGKHGAQAADFVGVPVELADRPGQLAGLFSDVGEIGVNVEDVRIEHVPGEPVGLVELSVRPEAEATLAEALRLRGWTVHG
jgi:prephenate dehydrogenase